MSTNIIVLDRAQMGRRHLVPNPIDTTVKSSKFPWKWLAPTWDMVMGHKAGTVSDAVYRKKYAVILRKADWSTIISQLQGKENVTFVCYCPDGVFCHTHLIINFMLESWPHLFIDGRSDINKNIK